MGKLGVGGGIRISAAANAAPKGEFGGVMVTLARNVEVFTWTLVISWSVKVLSVSCRTYNSSSAVEEFRTCGKERRDRTYRGWQYDGVRNQMVVA